MSDWEKDRVLGRERVTEPKRDREGHIEEGMYFVCPLKPRNPKEAYIIGIFHLQTIQPTHAVSRLPDASLAISGFT